MTLKGFERALSLMAGCSTGGESQPLPPWTPPPGGRSPTPVASRPPPAPPAAGGESQPPPPWPPPPGGPSPPPSAPRPPPPPPPARRAVRPPPPRHPAPR